MDYDGSQWPQGIINGVVNKPIREDTPSSSRETLERRAIRSQKGPQQEADLNCPRCNSTNTKFCYYNNYSLSQPRHFCKTCRRYWTQGGSLRNVPVGGGSRKNKRSSSTTTTTTTTSSTKKNVIGSPNLTPPAGSLIQSNPQNPILIQGHDLNLAYDSHLPLLRQNPSFASCESSWGNFMVLNNFPQPGSADSIGNVYPSGRLFSPLQELKPTLHYFSLRNETTNGLGSGIGGNSNGNAQERTKARGGDGDDVLIYEHGNSRRQGDHSPGGHNWNSSGMFGGGGSWQL